MRSYIVRIHHRDGKDPKKMAGVVEEIGKEGKRGFLGPDSLWRILCTPSPKPVAVRKAPQRGKEEKGGRRKFMTFTEILQELNEEE
jgi:hypothetical protein